jgi:hypothetical protein
MATRLKPGEALAQAVTDARQWRRLKILAATNGQAIRYELQAAIDAHLAASSNTGGGDQGA